MNRAARRRVEAAERAEGIEPTAHGEMGSVAVLNVGAGDLTLTFDKDKPEERERAKGIVQDMLRRGYAILVQVGVEAGEAVYRRAKAFDPETCEYVVVGVPEEAEPAVPPKVPRPRGRPRKYTEQRIPADQTCTVAVARSAGG